MVGIEFSDLPRLKPESSKSGRGLLPVYPQIVMSGVFFPIETLPEFIQPFSEILPLSIVADAMRSISSDGLSLLAVYKNIIGISIWIVIGTFVSTKLFVWKEVAG